MSSSPSVVVRKGGFFSALFHGVFGLLVAVVVCGTLLAGYGLFIVDRNAGRILSVGREVVASMPEWQKALPPVLADAVNDRRDPGYREHLDVQIRTEADPRRDGSGVAVIEVKNNGSETVSLLALHVLIEDEHGTPLREMRTYVATPLSMPDDEWRGPLLGGSKRVCIEELRRFNPGWKASVEVTDIRVWSGPQASATLNTAQGRTAELPVAASSRVEAAAGALGVRETSRVRPSQGADDRD